MMESSSREEENKMKDVKIFLGRRKEAGDTAIKDIKNIFRLKISGTWKVQLTIAISFISSRDNDEEPVIHSKK